jgi:hypothetical protein
VGAPWRQGQRRRQGAAVVGEIPRDEGWLK